MSLLLLWRLGGIPCLSSEYDDSVGGSRSQLPKEQVWNSEEHAYPEEHSRLTVKAGIGGLRMGTLKFVDK
jgi:hypothetical protein